MDEVDRSSEDDEGRYPYPVRDEDDATGLEYPEEPVRVVVPGFTVVRDVYRGAGSRRFGLDPDELVERG
ncbi:hypothetical protein [Dactylosporangium sp. NPDC000521]|uniref:hypothetical protein n=1 Tax=Dactylosporangium sp. NPDC000521 TaxID=3363975 RepID=UPI003674C6B0